MAVHKDYFSSSLHVLIKTYYDLLYKTIKRCTNGCNLCQHIITVSSFFPEAFETISMTRNTRKPFGYVVTRWIVLYMCQCKSTFPPREIFYL